MQGYHRRTELFRDASVNFSGASLTPKSAIQVWSSSVSVVSLPTSRMDFSCMDSPASGTSLGSKVRVRAGLLLVDGASEPDWLI